MPKVNVKISYVVEVDTDEVAGYPDYVIYPGKPNTTAVAMLEFDAENENLNETDIDFNYPARIAALADGGELGESEVVPATKPSVSGEGSEEG